MAESLNSIERRVLGVLLEKSLAQPAYYPMTLNSISVACNQRVNRDPVMDVDEDTAWGALEELRKGGWVSRILPQGSSRVDKFRHEVQTKLGLEKPQRAVLTELLLRGPQTVGELRTRCARMYAFENLEAVSAVLEHLGQAGLAAPLPRVPGQSATRYAHKLYPPGEQPETVAEAAEPARAATMPSGASIANKVGEGEVEALRAEIAELREECAELRRRVETLEGLVRG